MIEQQGQVIRVEADRAWVRVGAQSGCSACAAGKGCGAGLFGRLLRPHVAAVAIDSSSGAEVGQTVALGLEDRTFLGMVLLMYGVPLFSGLAGGMLGHFLALRHFPAGSWQGDLATGVLALLAVWAVFTLSRRWIADHGSYRSLKWLGVTTRLDCPSSGLN